MKPIALPLLGASLLLASCGGGTPTTDTTAPTVTLSGTPPTAPGDFLLTASASDNVGVTRVEFYQGDTLIAADTSAPYTATVTLDQRDNGAVSFRARAYDAAGNVGEGRLNTTINVSSLYQGQYEWAAFTDPQNPGGSVVAEGGAVFYDQNTVEGVTAALGAYLDVTPAPDQQGPALLGKFPDTDGTSYLTTVFAYDTKDADPYLIGFDFDGEFGTYEGQPIFEGAGTILNSDGTTRNDVVYFAMLRINTNPYAGTNGASPLRSQAMQGRALAFLRTLKGRALPGAAKLQPSILNRLGANASQFLH